MSSHFHPMSSHFPANMEKPPPPKAHKKTQEVYGFKMSSVGSTAQLARRGVQLQIEAADEGVAAARVTPRSAAVRRQAPAHGADLLEVIFSSDQLASSPACPASTPSGDNDEAALAPSRAVGSSVTRSYPCLSSTSGAHLALRFPSTTCSGRVPSSSSLGSTKDFSLVAFETRTRTFRFAHSHRARGATHRPMKELLPYTSPPRRARPLEARVAPAYKSIANELRRHSEARLRANSDHDRQETHAKLSIGSLPRSMSWSSGTASTGTLLHADLSTAEGAGVGGIRIGGEGGRGASRPRTLQLHRAKVLNVEAGVWKWRPRPSSGR
jgi:hypothetical protein